MSKASFQKHREKSRVRQKEYYDRTAKSLPKIQVGSRVSVQMTPSSPWKRGTIVEVCPQPRSYTIATDDGSTLRRNRVRLSHRNSDEAIHSKQDYQNVETTQPSELVPKVSPVECPASPSLAALPEHNGNIVNVPTSAVTQQQTKPVPDRGGVTQTRLGRTIIKPTRLNL